MLNRTTTDPAPKPLPALPDGASRCNSAVIRKHEQLEQFRRLDAKHASERLKETDVRVAARVRKLTTRRGRLRVGVERRSIKFAVGVIALLLASINLRAFECHDAPSNYRD